MPLHPPLPRPLRRWLSGLRVRLAAVVLVAVLPLLARALYDAGRSRDRAVEDARGEVSDLATLLSVQEERTVSAARQLLGALSQVPSARPGSERCEPLMRALMAEYPRYTNLGVADGNGKVVCSGAEGYAFADLSGRPFFEDAVRTGEFSTGAYDVGAVTGEAAVFFAAPIADDPTGGVVFAALSLEALSSWDWTVEPTLPPGATLLKVDQNGRLIARYPTGGAAAGTRLQGWPSFVELASGTDGRGVYRTTDAVIAYARVPSNLVLGDLYVLLRVPEAALFAPIRRELIGRLLLIGSALTLGLALAQLAASRWVLRPVRRLERAAKAMAGGDGTARVGPPYGHSELGRLARTFDATADALVRSRSEYKGLVESAPYGIVRTTTDGRIRLANPAAARILGAERPEDLAGRFLTDAAGVDASPKLHLERGRTLVEEIWRAGGQARHVRWTAQPVEDEGEGFELFVEDVTRRHQLEEQFRQSQKMEAVGRLAAGVAHDFNNLLAVVLGHTELALSERRDDADLLAIHDATERASALTSRLLAFSRREPLAPRTVAIDPVVREFEQLLRRVVGADVALETDLGSRNRSATIDPVELEQVLLNLAINARDAMPDGGRIRLSTRQRCMVEPLAHEHGTVPAGDWIEICVSDTGHGMDATTRARLFEPFFTTKGPGRGTGLGLSTVARIVEQAGGHITVDSDPGEGSTFRVFLPVRHAVAPVAAPLPHAHPVRGDGHETVLVVEDEPALRPLVAELLEREGFTVLTADDVAGARELARRHQRIDLLLTDIVLPDGDGVDLARRLRAERPNLRVLFMSGYGETWRAVVPADAFLPKPFGMAELSEAVHRALSGPRGDLGPRFGDEASPP